jgi:hypothetical protein
MSNPLIRGEKNVLFTPYQKYILFFSIIPTTKLNNR